MAYRLDSARNRIPKATELFRPSSFSERPLFPEKGLVPMPLPGPFLHTCLFLAFAALLGSAPPALAANKGDISLGYTRTGDNTFLSIM